MTINRTIRLHPADKDWLIIHDLSQQIEDSSLSSVLELIVARDHSDRAHLYSVDPAACELRLVSASSTSEDCRIPRVSLELRPQIHHWLEQLETATVLSPDNPRFASFPETIASRVSSLLVSPLRVGGEFAGVLTLARQGRSAFDAAEIAAVAKSCTALVALIRAFDSKREVEILRDKLRALRHENVGLERRLLERKLVERAKGLLQSHYGWTEEDAYYHLRRTSRQERTPMAVIAQRIIDIAAAKVAERERLTA